MSPNELTKGEKVNSIIYGVIVGFITIFFSVLSIFYTKTADTYGSFYLVSTIFKILGDIIVPIGFVYFLKKRSGDVWTFSKALKSIYILLAISVIVSSLGITFSQKVFIPNDVIEMGYQNLMNLKIESMEADKATSSEIEQQLETIEQQRDFAFTKISFQNVIPPLFISLLLHFVFALLLAFLFRSHIQKKS